jgi:hypothetical protein
MSVVVYVTLSDLTTVGVLILINFIPQRDRVSSSSISSEVSCSSGEERMGSNRRGASSILSSAGVFRFLMFKPLGVELDDEVELARKSRGLYVHWHSSRSRLQIKFG